MTASHTRFARGEIASIFLLWHASSRKLPRRRTLVWILIAWRAHSRSPACGSLNGSAHDDVAASLSRATARGGGDASAQVAAEIDVLRASQRARDAMTAQRRFAAAADGMGLRSADGAKAGMSAMRGLARLPSLSMASEEELFAEIGYLMQERDLALKEKKALQHLLSQAAEEIRVLVAAEQRHVEELRDWVRQRDELLQNKAHGQQTASLCEGLKLRLEHALTQHRYPAPRLAAGPTGEQGTS